MGDNQRVPNQGQQQPEPMGALVLHNNDIKRMVENFLIQGGFYTRNNAGQIVPTNLANLIPTDIGPTITYEIAGTEPRITSLEELTNYLNVLDQRAGQIITNPVQYLLNFEGEHEVNAAAGEFTDQQRSDFDSIIRYLTGQGMTAKFINQANPEATGLTRRALPIITALHLIQMLAETIPEINPNELEYLYGALVVFPILQYNIRAQAGNNNVDRLNYAILLPQLQDRLDYLIKNRQRLILNPKESCLFTALCSAVVSLISCCVCSTAVPVAAVSTCGSAFLMAQLALRTQLAMNINDTNQSLNSAVARQTEQTNRRANEPVQLAQQPNIANPINAIQEMHAAHGALRQNLNENNIQAIGQPTNLVVTQNGVPTLVNLQHIMETHNAAVETMAQQLGINNAAGVGRPDDSSSSSQSNYGGSGLITNQYETTSRNDNNNANNTNNNNSDNDHADPATPKSHQMK